MPSRVCHAAAEGVRSSGEEKRTLVSAVSCFSVFIVRDSTDLTGESVGDRGVTARQMGSESAGRDGSPWKIRVENTGWQKEYAT